MSSNSAFSEVVLIALPVEKAVVLAWPLLPIIVTSSPEVTADPKLTVPVPSAFNDTL